MNFSNNKVFVAFQWITFYALQFDCYRVPLLNTVAFSMRYFIWCLDCHFLLLLFIIIMPMHWRIGTCYRSRDIRARVYSLLIWIVTFITLNSASVIHWNNAKKIRFITLLVKCHYRFSSTVLSTSDAFRRVLSCSRFQLEKRRKMRQKTKQKNIKVK